MRHETLIFSTISMEDLREVFILFWDRIKKWFFERKIKTVIKKLVEGEFYRDKFICFHSEAEAKYYGESEFGEWSKSIIDSHELQQRSLPSDIYSPTTLLVFRLYCGYIHIDVNHYLRTNTVINGDRANIFEIIRLIDLQISSKFIKDNIVAIRWVRDKQKHNVNDLIYDNAFKSTSLNLSYRPKTDTELDLTNKSTFLIIRIPKGSNALYLNVLSNRDSEQELLLPRTAHLKVEKKFTTIFNNSILLCSIFESKN